MGVCWLCFAAIGSLKPVAASVVGCRFAARSRGAVLRLSRRILLSVWALISQREASSLLMFLLHSCCLLLFAVSAALLLMFLLHCCSHIQKEWLLIAAVCWFCFGWGLFWVFLVPKVA
ncbi:hypothetical protein U1Q18_047157 [Sarracenia purpurea var. burkii]